MSDYLFFHLSSTSIVSVHGLSLSLSLSLSVPEFDVVCYKLFEYSYSALSLLSDPELNINVDYV